MKYYIQRRKAHDGGRLVTYYEVMTDDVGEFGQTVPYCVARYHFKRDADEAAARLNKSYYED